jgi:hypothetical protein
MTTYKDHGFYTHQPYVMEVLKTITGNILECGCGDGSTYMIKKHIHDTSDQQCTTDRCTSDQQCTTNRQLVSLESNLEWLNKYTHLADANHQLYHVATDNTDCLETGNKWVDFIQTLEIKDFEMVFLDSSPWMSRKCCFDYFLNISKIIIIHDFDYFPNNNIIGTTISKTNVDGKEKIVCDLTGIVKNYRLFYPPYKYFIGLTGPPTLICSNIMEKDEFDALMNVIETNEASYYE